MMIRRFRLGAGLENGVQLRVGLILTPTDTYILGDHTFPIHLRRKAPPLTDAATLP